MPGMDRTGPLGQGPLTGRGLGLCGRGLGFGRGMGRGFGRRMMIMPQAQAIPQEIELTKAEENKILKADLEDLKAEAKEIEKRLKELKD